MNPDGMRETANRIVPNRGEQLGRRELPRFALCKKNLSNLHSSVVSGIVELCQEASIVVKFTSTSSNLNILGSGDGFRKARPDGRLNARATKLAWTEWLRHASRRLQAQIGEPCLSLHWQHSTLQGWGHFVDSFLISRQISSPDFPGKRISSTTSLGTVARKMFIAVQPSKPGTTV